MKTNLLSAKYLGILVFTLATLCFASSTLAKKGGNGGGKPGGEEPPPVDPSCLEYSSDFPAFAYTVLNFDRRGRGTGYDFFLSNADADCRVLVHSSEYSSRLLELSYSQNGGDGVIVWTQIGNEHAGRKDIDGVTSRIKMIRFQTSNKEVTSPLPLVSSDVAVVIPGSAPSGRNSFQFVELSADNSTILVSHEDTHSVPGSIIDSIREINITTCSINCPLSDPLISTEDEFILIGPSYSPMMDRIYYASAFDDDSDNPLAGRRYVAFIEKQGDSWSDPRYVALSGSGHLADSRYFWQSDVATMDLGNGSTEVLAIWHRPRDDINDHAYIEIIDVGSCAALGSGDCLTTGESKVVTTIPDGQQASFDKSFDASKLFFSTSDISPDQEIIEYDFLSDTERRLAFGFRADSGY